MIFRLLIFIIINFGALAIGGMFTGKGVPSEWYVNLAKAPWTPPGWVFGFAWTAIMIFFSVYLANLWLSISDKKLLIALFAFQWILNVGWNPIFFHYHYVLAGLLVISSLTVLVGAFIVIYWSELKYMSLLLAPYFIWLLIATSLNAYVLVKN